MAQVRKLQGGGNTEKPKYGRIIVNGEVVNDSVTDNDISAWFGSDEIGSALSSMIKSGDIRINTNGESNEIEGLSSYLSPKTKVWRNQNRFNKTFENRATREARNKIDHYATINYNKAEKGHDTYDFSRDLNLVYDVNSPDLISKTADWSKAKDRISEYLRIANEGLNKGVYNWHKNSGFKGGLNPDGDDVKSYITRVSDRLKTILDSDFSIFDEGDLDILKSIGINISDNTKLAKGVSDSKEVSQNGDNETHDYDSIYKKLGLDKTIPWITGMNMTKNTNGSYTIDKSWIEANPSYKRVHITDDWLSDKPWFSSLKGGFFFDGMYIPKELAEDQSGWFYPKIAPYYKKANIEGVDNELGIDRWGSMYNQFLKYDPKTGIYPNLHDYEDFNKLVKEGKDVWVAPFTDNLGREGYSYYTTEAGQNHIWGMPASEYINNVVFDKDGKANVIDKGFQSAYNKNHNKIKTSEEYPGFYEMNATDKDGNEVTFYINVDNGDVAFKSKKMDSPYLLTPEEEASLLGYNGNINYKTKFNEIANAFVDKQERKEWDWWNKLIGNKTTALQKKQTGGPIKPEYNYVNIEQEIDKVGNTETPALDSLDLTLADKIQIASLGFDASALAASGFTGFAPNPVSAGLGVVGTIADTASGILRDGIGWDDFGNLASNIGGDAIPALGFAKSLKKAYNMLNKVFTVTGMTQAALSLGNIVTKGSMDINDLQNVVNGLSAFSRHKFNKKQSNISKYSPETKTKTVSVESLRNEYLDKFVSKNKSVTKINGSDVEWYDSNTGKIKSGSKDGKSYYDLAYEGLKGKKKSELGTDEDFSFNEDSALKRVEAYMKNKNEASKSFFNKYNVFSDNFKYDDKNLKLMTKKDDVWVEADRDDISKMLKENYSQIWDLYRRNPNIRKQLDDLHMAPYMNPFEKFITSNKNGGIIKAEHGLSGFGNKDIEPIEWYGFANNAARLVGALNTTNKQEKIQKDALDAARHNIRYAQMEMPRFSSAALDRSRDNAIRRINNQFIPLHSDAKLNMAGNLSKAGMTSEIEANYGSQLSNLIDTSNNRNSQIKYQNLVNEVNAVNAKAEQDAKIESGKKSLESDSLGVKWGIFQKYLEQNYGEHLNNIYNKEMALRSYNNSKALDDYNKERSEITNELSEAIKNSGLSAADFEKAGNHLSFQERLSAAERNYNSKIAMNRFNYRLNHLTGLRDYYEPYSSTANTNRSIPGKDFSFKKGGKLSGNDKRVLESMRAELRELSKKNDRILKRLLNIFDNED